MDDSTVNTKSQPWKKGWPPQELASTEGIQYGIPKGGTVVVDGTSSNVKSTKLQPWKKHWPPQDQKQNAGSHVANIEYGVEKGETVVLDGTSANIKPVGELTVNEK